jgi:hypothetical protein
MAIKLFSINGCTWLKETAHYGKLKKQLHTIGIAFDCWKQSLERLLHPSIHLSILPGKQLTTLDLPVL